MLIELYKVIKFRVPYSIFGSLSMSNRRVMLVTSKVRLDKRKHNFFCNAALKWNKISKYLIKPYVIIVKNSDGESVTMNYDLTASVSLIKTTLKKILLNIQCHGDEHQWSPSNYNLSTYNHIITHSIYECFHRQSPRNNQKEHINPQYQPIQKHTKPNENLPNTDKTTETLQDNIYILIL